MPDLTYISKGNSKTECFSFDLPAIETCPGKTTECSRDCYAANLMRIYPSVDAKYRRNLEIAHHPDFVAYMVDTIPANCQFRIHVSGDFFHPDYAKRWAKIASARPDVTFYAYTRSWREPDIWAQILLLHDLPNVNVNLSVDDETGAPHYLYDGNTSVVLSHQNRQRSRLDPPGGYRLPLEPCRTQKASKERYRQGRGTARSR